jgi:hypothetical protein
LTNLELRVWRIEQAINAIQTQIANILTQLGQLAQNQWVGSTGGQGGGGGGGFFVCYPASPVSGATWSAHAPSAAATFSAAIWQCSISGGIMALGSQSCANWLPVPLQAGYPCVVVPDGQGGYGVVSQSCASA